jgi:hypothetical protein
MASSYSSDLKLELMVTGEKSGLWGDITNTNLTILQQAIAGFEAISIAGGAQTTALTFSNGLISNGKNAVIKFTGTITGNQVVTIPDGIEKTYIIENGTTGAHTVEFKTVSGTGVTFATTNKGFKILYSDGTNIVDVELSSVNPTIEKILDTNGNEEIIFTATGSAVNELTIANAATTAAPEISTTGSDTNIDLRLNTKGTGGVVFNAGAVATPSITTTGDTNTGIFFPSADTIAFTEGGAEAMRINSDAQTVHTLGTVLLPSMTFTGDVNTGIFSPTADTIAFTEGGTEAMRINSSGQVGIGKTATTFPLEVAGGIQSTYVFAALTTIYSINNASFDFNISSITGTIPNVENSMSFELTLRERSTDTVQLFRLFYIRIGPGTTFNISSAIVSFGSTDATTTISYPSAGNIRFTNTSFSVGNVMIRRISS